MSGRRRRTSDADYFFYIFFDAALVNLTVMVSYSYCVDLNDDPPHPHTHTHIHKFIYKELALVGHILYNGYMSRVQNKILIYTLFRKYSVDFIIF